MEDFTVTQTRGGSPSSRRAWIEMMQTSSKPGMPSSPSSRRAWIEILGLPSGHSHIIVALLAEGVDRNTCKK